MIIRSNVFSLVFLVMLFVNFSTFITLPCYLFAFVCSEALSKAQEMQGFQDEGEILERQVIRDGCGAQMHVQEQQLASSNALE